MTLHEGDLQALVIKLDSDDPDPDLRLRNGSIGLVLDEIIFHASKRYWQFTPTHADAPPFLDRLWKWLNNAILSEQDVVTLLKSVPSIQFIDRDDMLALYRSAFTGPISRWLLDQLALDFSIPRSELHPRLTAASEHTWYCPITDSMDIAQFHHVNDLAHKEHRPCWRTLKTFGDISLIEQYMAKEGLQRLVLLEDFVGSGTQTLPAVRFAATKLPSVPILFVPLVISAFGLESLKDRISHLPNLAIEPVFVIPKHAHVIAEPQTGEPEIYSRLREVVNRTFAKVRQPLPPCLSPLDDAFGFNSVGGLVVLYTNCPNNTVPLYWHNSPDWAPLFPRVSRH